MADTVIFKIRVDSKDVVKHLETISGSFAGIGSVALGVASKVTGAFKKIGEFAFETLGDSVKASMRYEDAMSGVKRTANLSAEQMDVLGKKVRDLSIENLKGAVSAEQLGEILEIAGQRGIITGENFNETIGSTLQFTESIAKMAQALDLSFGKAADSVGKFHSRFSDDPALIGNTANAFNVLADSTEASADSMIKIAERLGPTLSSFNVLESEVIGLSGALDSLGIRPQRAATALEQLFSKLNRNTQGFAESFAINADQLNNLVQTDITGAFQLVLEHINTMKESGPDGVQKVTQALAELQITGSGVTTAILGLAGLGPELEEKFLKPAAEGITNMNSINTEFANSTARLSVLWEGLKNTVGDLLISIGDPLKDALSELIKINLMPLITQFREWFNDSTLISDLWPKIINTVKQGFIDILNPVKAFIGDQEKMDSLFKSAGETILTMTQRVREFVGHMVDYLQSDFPRDWEKFKQGLSNATELIKVLWNVFTDPEVPRFLAETLVDGFQAVNTAIEGAKIVWETLTGTIRDLQSITAPFFDFAVENFFNIKEIIGGVIDAVIALSTAFTSPIQTLKDLYNAAQRVFDGLMGWISSAVSAVGKLASALANVISKIRGVAKEGWESSTFPELGVWLVKNREQVDSLAGSFAGTIAEINKMGNVSDTQKQKLRELAVAQENLRQIQGAGNSLFMSPQARAKNLELQGQIRKQISSTRQELNAAGPTQAGQSLTINFMGGNIIDESSVKRFAAVITEVQQDRAGLMLAPA